MVMGMPDETPGRERPDLMWSTVRLDYGAFTRETIAPQQRAMFMIDGGPGSAIRETFLRFDLEDFFEQYKNDEIEIQELRVKLNIMGTDQQPIGIYLMPPHMSEFNYRTIDGAFVAATRPPSNSSMRNNVEYLVGRLTPRSPGHLLTADLWNGVDGFGIRDFLAKYPDITGVTMRLSKLYQVGSNGLALTHTGARTIVTMTGMTRMPNEPIMRVGYISDAIRRVRACIAELNITDDPLNISENLTLPTSWHNGVAINWHSSNPSVINPATGAVNRPAFGAGDRDVTLTATFSYADFSYQVRYDLTVLAMRANPAHAHVTFPVDTTATDALVGNSTITADVSSIMASIANLDSVWLRLIPLNGRFNVGDNVTVTFGGNTITSQLDDSGSVYIGDLSAALAAAGSNNVTFNIQSTAAFNGATVNVTPDLRPAIFAPTLQDALNETADYITADAIYYGDINYVRGNLNLFTEWRYSAIISWASIRPDIIDPATGIITRPQTDTPVTLTATVTIGSLSTTRTINIIALGLNSDAAYFERLFSEMTFPRTVETYNFTLPTNIARTQLTVDWESSSPYIVAINAGSGDYVNVIIDRPRFADNQTRITAIIDDDGTRVEHDFVFTIVRHSANNLFINRLIIDDDDSEHKRLAISENLDIPWRIEGNNRTISIDSRDFNPFSEFLVVYEGLPVSGLRVYSSRDALSWQHMHTTGLIQPNRANLISLSTAVYARFVRFVFPTGVSAVNLVAGYATGTDANEPGGNIFEGLNLPSVLTAPFEVPEFINGFAISSLTSANPSVIRIENNVMTPIPQASDMTINVTVAINIDGNTHTLTSPTRVPRTSQGQTPPPGGPGGPSGPSGPGGSSRPPGGGMDVGNIGSLTPPPPEDRPVELPFTDIDGHWAARQIVWLYSRDIIGGMGDGTFAPNNPMTREQMATIIMNAFDLERTNDNSPFADAIPGDWFFNAVSAMYDHGISLGDGTGNFGVGLNITRQDAVVLLYRYITNTMEWSYDLVEFADSDTIADYAWNAVHAMRAAGIVGGTPDGNFNPTAQITRAEMAVIIYRTLEFLRN